MQVHRHTNGHAEYTDFNICTPILPGQLSLLPFVGWLNELRYFVLDVFCGDGIVQFVAIICCIVANRQRLLWM